MVRAWLVDGPPEAEVTFTASAMVADDPAATSVSGVVLDNSDVPVPGATVSIEGTTLSTRTDAVGYFRLDGAPVGTTHLRVRGATVERPGVWPSLEFLITIIAGRDNSMGRPIYLPVLDLANALAVDEDTGGVLTMRDLPGFALEIEPGSVTFPGGGRSGVITVTPVHSDKVPMPPNFGQQPRFVITIQPGGAHFDPPGARDLPQRRWPLARAGDGAVFFRPRSRSIRQHRTRNRDRRRHPHRLRPWCRHRQGRLARRWRSRAARHLSQLRRVQVAVGWRVRRRQCEDAEAEGAG